MSDPAFVVFDVSYLAHRAFHSMGNLSHDDIPTAVAYGVFQSIETIQRYWETPTSHMIFTFDKGPLKRQDLFAGYKQRRRDQRESSKDKEREHQIINSQIDRLHEEILPRIGFVNNFRFKGYEADDIIAVVCKKLEDAAVMIVSTDKDLYQLLSKKHYMWNLNTQETFTLKKFQTQFGIEPLEWRAVKAIAGCSSDNIPGVHGVGEATAIKWLKNEKISDKRRKDIEAAKKSGDLKLYWKLVRLPFDSDLMSEVKIGENRVKQSTIDAAFHSLGIKSIALRV